MKNEEPGLSEAQENNTMITFGRKLKHLILGTSSDIKELRIAQGFQEKSVDVRIAQRGTEKVI